jgi:hypothetical protein
MPPAESESHGAGGSGKRELADGLGPSAVRKAFGLADATQSLTGDYEKLRRRRHEAVGF